MLSCLGACGLKVKKNILAKSCTHFAQQFARIDQPIPMLPPNKLRNKVGFTIYSFFPPVPASNNIQFKSQLTKSTDVYNIHYIPIILQTIISCYKAFNFA